MAGWGLAVVVCFGNVCLRWLGHRKAVMARLAMFERDTACFGSQGNAGYVAAEWGLARQSGRVSQGASCQRMARIVSVWQSWRVNLC